MSPSAHDPNRTTVLLVDDHELLRKGLRDLLTEHGFDVVGDAADGASGLELARRLAPDVIVMDVGMPGISGIETTRRVRAETPTARVLMLTISSEDADVGEAILAGACGYILKYADPDEIVAAVRAAAAGESLISPAIASRLLEHWRAGGTIPPAGDAALTERERQVLSLMAEGKDNAEIAAELVVSVHTVRNHVSNVLAKLEVENRIQAAVQAVRRRLV